MAALATTKMSSKGQVVIPEEIRKRLGLKAGSQFVVVGDKNLLRVSGYRGIKIIRPRRFVNKYLV